LELYKSYKEDVINSYDVIQPKLEALAELYPQEPIYAQVLRWLQFHLQEYWTEVEVASGPVSPPNFKMLFEAIRYKQWLRPEISLAYLQKTKRTRLETSFANGGSGTASGVTSSQATEGAPAPAAGAAKKHAYARNESPRSDLVEKAARIGKINVFLEAAGNGTALGVPKMDAGAEMRLVFHTKGRCYKDCGRATGHGALRDSESNRLCKFMTRIWQ
jgi:hypothetical protein